MSEMQDWQRNLATHTGQWAFVLSLSRNMVFVLRQVRDNSFSWTQTHTKEQRQSRSYCGIKYNLFVPGIRGLISRGLVRHVELPKGTKIDVAPFVLTPAGVAVCHLLVYAELMPKQRIKTALREEQPA